MARKKKPIRIRVAPSGATVGLVLPRERMDELLSVLPEGELRDLLIGGTETADERARIISHEKRLDTSLSHESLAVYGWDLIGDESPIAFAAMRRGDFRYAVAEGVAGWECGPSGAFDRDPEGTRIMRGAVQVGVFSERQIAFRLLDPTHDADGAVAEIVALARHWHQALKHMRRPSHEIYDTERAKALLELPEGARALRYHVRHGDAALRYARDGDEVLHGSRSMHHVSIFPCEAVMRPSRRFDEACGRALFTGLTWCVGRREPDPRYAHHDGRSLLDGPCDIVMGSSWAVWTNKPNGGLTRRGNPVDVAHPSDSVGMPTREEAVQQAADMAAIFGLTDPVGGGMRKAA
jgi:hypothetical protein